MISFSKQFHMILKTIVASEDLHAKWLNTLSFLENCGARKIAACEHPTLVKEEMLKHAAEEFRHAHHLKRQIEKVSSAPMDSYVLSSMLGGIATQHYLTSLDLQTSRYLKSLPKSLIKEYAYLFVTYAIELRAGELYPIYDQVLRDAGSRVAIKSILLEEKEHLNEMRQGISKIPSGFFHAEHICSLESKMCKSWIEGVYISIKNELCPLT